MNVYCLTAVLCVVVALTALAAHALNPPARPPMYTVRIIRCTGEAAGQFGLSVVAPNGQITMTKGECLKNRADVLESWQNFSAAVRAGRIRIEIEP
jgi:hypothetical protein